jgi:DNA-binding HxlR family transcriptional regulator
VVTKGKDHGWGAPVIDPVSDDGLNGNAAEPDNDARVAGADDPPHTPGQCPMDAVLRLLMGPWTTYIVWLLETQGPLRFGEIKSRMPAISSKVLTERLRHLEAARLVSRDYKPTIPPQVTYTLTARGHELKGVLDAINVIAVKWRDEDKAPATA